MEMLSYILIAAAAIISGLFVFIFTKLVISQKTDTKISLLQKEKEESVSVLESKLQETEESKNAILEELSAYKEQVFRLKNSTYTKISLPQKEKSVSVLESKLQKTEESKNAIFEELSAYKEQVLNLQQQITDSSALREQITKLEKEIKRLEDEIENYENEIDDLTAKLKNKKNEVNELEEQLRIGKKENNKLQNEINTTTAKLDSTQKTLAIQNESLSFVQEILQAKKASDGKDLENAIDRFTDFIEGDLSDVLKETSESKLKVDESLLRNWSLLAKKTWLKNKTTIAFVGEFSAGKTSIVNRILSQDDKNIPLLPVSAKATTAIPTYISGGAVTAYQFYSPDNILKAISETTFKKVTKEVLDQVEGLSSLITYFVMKYKNPNLKKLSILDTPGFNSNDSEDSHRTIEVINECDALFWVFDVNTGTINRSSLKIIKEYLTKPLYIVINKVDTKSTKEIESVETLIKKTIEAEGIKVKEYIRFSSNPQYELSSIMNPIYNVVRDISKDEFISELENSLIDLKNEWIEKVKERTSSFEKSRKKHECIVDQYETSQEQLYQACYRAVEIPKFKTHMFKKDNYEMSQQEYAQLCTTLESIATGYNEKLSKLFDESNEIVDEMNTQYNEKLKAEQSLRELNDIIEKFKKHNTNMKKKCIIY